MSDLEKILYSIYGENDLAEHPFFTGEFINFGYWPDIAMSPEISVSERTKASRNLYAHLFECLDIKDSDQLCEIGFGHGLGLLMAAEKFSVKNCYGVDMQREQVERAGSILKRAGILSEKIQLRQGRADNTGLATGSVSVVYSVEAAHHFPDFGQFLSESARILRPNGTVGLTTLFPTSDAALQKLPEVVPDLDLKMHPMISMQEIQRLIPQYGFKLVSLTSIGADVFPGFQKWIDQTGRVESWGPIWLKAFEHGLIDYYVLIGSKTS